MMRRRTFLKLLAAVGVGSALPAVKIPREWAAKAVKPSSKWKLDGEVAVGISHNGFYECTDYTTRVFFTHDSDARAFERTRALYSRDGMTFEAAKGARLERAGKVVVVRGSTVMTWEVS